MPSRTLDTLRTYGVRPFIYRMLFKSRLITWQQIVDREQRRGRVPHFDGVTVPIDSPKIVPAVKAIIIVGVYEDAERELIKQHLPSDEPVIELGASIGVISCMTNKRLRTPDKHVVVEARPDLIPLLTAMRERNHCSFAIVNTAVAYGQDTVEFFHDDTNLGSSVHSNSTMKQSSRVKASTLEQIAADAHFQRVALICDIEGSEIELIEHEGNFLRDHVSWLLIELHPGISGEAAVAAAQERLTQLGFERVGKSATVLCLRNVHLSAVDTGASVASA